jgi:hypothetical protein
MGCSVSRPTHPGPFDPSHPTAKAILSSGSHAVSISFSGSSSSPKHAQLLLSSPRKVKFRIASFASSAATQPLDSAIRLYIVTATRLKEEEDSKRAAQQQQLSYFCSAAALQRASKNAALAISPSPSPVPLSVNSRYQLSSTVLGNGHFARVQLATDRVTGVQVAVKSIDKKEMVKNRVIVEAELNILRRLGHHRHVVSMLDYYEDERCFFIVMEYCQGGTLFSKIVEQGKYTELQAVRCCRQIAEALQYIHSCGITHRDLKPENILLTDNGVDADIKLADFGLSKILNAANDVMHTVCGTWAYCAPEVISHQSYTSRVDNWTLGVLMFILLCGYHPFDCYGDLSEPELLDKIMRVEYEFDDPVWEDVTAAAK